MPSLKVSLRVLFLRCLLLAGSAIVLANGQGLRAADYYVSNSGNDLHAGTLAQPFQTIQRAAQYMVAGDNCYIRAGTYRETVTPANSGTAAAPITFQPYGNEAVTISGANVVSGWTVHSGGIYKAALTEHLGDEDQVFVDGQMMNLARWPNTSLDVSRQVTATAANGSYTAKPNADGTNTGAITDPALTQTAGFFKGARIHFIPGPVWVAQTGTVTSSAPGSVQFHWLLSDPTMVPQAGNPYYLFGLLSLLDTPGEWFIDAASNTLYLWPPQNDTPDSHVVETKRRDYAFDFSATSYVTVQHISLFACAINSSPASQNITLDGLNCRYVSHFSLINVAGMWDYHMNDTGLILNGSHHVLRNSTVAYSAGNGVTLIGDHHLVENCLIHDVDYAHLDCAAINTGNADTVTSDHEIRFNTCYNSGHGLLLIRSLVRGWIHNNDLYRSMLGTTDSGAVYTYSHDGQNTDISYNIIHDNVCAGNAAVGVYLDNNSSNFRVHHNLIYNTCLAMEYNLPSVNILWYNNTAVALNSSLTGGYTGSQAGTQVSNNIFTAPVVTYPDATVSDNLLSTTDPQFVSSAGLDFRLQSTSPAHDAGLVLPPYTNGYEGAAPDDGALEYNQPPWSAGSPLAASIPAGPTNLTAAVVGSAIQLSWADNSNNETSFVVERSVDNQVYTFLARLPSNTTSYTDALAGIATSYYYRVRADESACSNYVSAMVGGRDAFSTIPAISLDGQSGLILDGVLASCDDGDWARYAAVNFGSGASQIRFRLSSAENTTTNFIEVRLGSVTGTRIANVNIKGTGGYSNFVTVTSAIAAVSGVHDIYLVFKGGFGVCALDTLSFAPPAPLKFPQPPAGLTASVLPQYQIQIKWTAPGVAVDGIKIERSLDNQTFTEIASVSSSTTTVTDGGLQAGQAYYYRARAFNRLGLSVYSPTVGPGPPITAQPQPLSVFNTYPATFSVTATGSGTLTYHWRKNGNNIPGAAATGSTYTISAAAITDAASYDVLVTDSKGTTQSSAATLTVVPVISGALTVNITPNSTAVNPGASVNFTANVTSGSVPSMYQWRKDGVKITGATQSIYALSNVKKAAEGSYDVQVTNSFGTATAAGASLSVNDPVVIVFSPFSQAANVGGPVTLSMIATGTAPLTCQWRINNTPLNGETSATLSFTADSTKGGNYDVVVTNVVGSVTSNSATVTILAPPVIISPPHDQLVNAGSQAQFSVTATGIGLTCQWRRDGVDIAGKTGTTLTISNAQAANVGSYDVRVHNAYGTVISDSAALQLIALLNITSQPADVTANIGDSATFNVTAAGPGVLGCQWYKNGIPLTGAKSATLTVPVADGSAAGVYTVTVTLGALKATSSPASLRVNDGGLLLYNVTATGTTVQAETSRAVAVTGTLVLDRANQRGGFIWFGKSGTTNTFSTEINANLRSHSTGPVASSVTVITRVTETGTAPNQDENLLWLKGTDSLLTISTADKTVGPQTLAGTLNSLILNGITVQALTLAGVLDAASSSQARQSSETVERTINRLVAGWQLKGYAPQ